MPAATIVRTLAALDVDASTPEAAERALEEHDDAPWRRMLPPHRGGPPRARRRRCEVHVRDGAPVSLWIELERGGTRSDVRQVENWYPPRHLDGRTVGEASFELPGDLPLGYHTLRAWSDGETASAALIVTPAWVGLPERMGGRGAWGVATQLYSVRSAQSWGVGDVVDLADLAVWGGAEHGAGFVLVNPLHAAEPVPPMEPSPYLPTTRRFQNPLYLRVERIPEYADLDAAAVATSTRSGPRCTGLDDARTTSTGMPPGRRKGRRWNGCTRCNAPPAGTSPTGPTGAGGRGSPTTTRPGAR